VPSDEMADLIAHFTIRGSSASLLGTPTACFPLMLVLLRFFGEPIHDTRLELNQLSPVKPSASTRETAIAQPGGSCSASALLEQHSLFCRSEL